MKWYEEPTTRIIIEEVAEEFSITPSDVLGVLSCVFDGMLNLSEGLKVKMFTIRGFGSFVVRGHIPKNAKSKKKEDAAFKFDKLLQGTNSN